MQYQVFSAKLVARQRGSSKAWVERVRAYRVRAQLEASAWLGGVLMMAFFSFFFSFMLEDVEALTVFRESSTQVASPSTSI